MEKENKKVKKDEEKILKEQIETLNEEVLRAKADLINYRKRKDEEVSILLKNSSSDLLLKILSVKDNFERALTTKGEISPELNSFLEGFKMIYNSLDEIIKSEGVKEINPIGEIFNSNLENCLYTESHEDKKDEEVLSVFTKGYMYNDRILRCAQVSVNKLNKNIEKESENNE